MNKFLDALGIVKPKYRTFSDKPFKSKNKIKDHDGKYTDSASIVTTSLKKAMDMQKMGACVAFQVNEGDGRGSSSVKRIRCLFLDLDDSPIEPVLEAVKTGKLPKPNVIVRSSRGKHHVYWRVGDCALPDFKRYQKLLAYQFNGDHAVSDPARVMRMPGSINFKYPEKEVVKAKILHSTIYDTIEVIGQLDDFNFNVRPEVLDKQLRSNDDMILTGSDFKSMVLAEGDRTQKLIKYIGFLVGSGLDDVDAITAKVRQFEKEHTQKGSELISEADWDTEIAPAIERFVDRDKTDLDFQKKETARTNREMEALVSTSCWDRSIEVDLSYQDFCERFIYVRQENSVYDMKSPASVEGVPVGAFKIWAKPYKLKQAKRGLADKWLEDQHNRRTVELSTYKPFRCDKSEAHRAGRIVIDDLHKVVAYNRYQPCRLTMPIKADLTKCAIGMHHISHLMNHDTNNINRLLDWLAFTVQKPEQRIPWVPLIISSTGQGKGVFGELLKQLVGSSNVNTVEMAQFGDQKFNGFMGNCKVVLLPECKGAKSLVENMKASITETEMTVNEKYGREGQRYIYCNFFGMTNHPDAFDLGEDDRRWWVVRCKQALPPPQYFTDLFAWVYDGEGPAHLLRYLMNRDLSKFHHAARPPMTPEKSMMMRLTRPLIEQEVIDLFDSKEGVFAGELVTFDQVLRLMQTDRNEPLDDKERKRLRMYLGRRFAPIGTYRIGARRSPCYIIRNEIEWDCQSLEDQIIYLNEVERKQLDSYKLRSARGI